MPLCPYMTYHVSQLFLPLCTFLFSDGVSAENNDDRVLQCCLQYQSLYPECALILCT